MAMANTDDALALVAKKLLETDTIGAVIAPGAVYTAYPRAGQDEVPMPCIVLALESGDMVDANLSMLQVVVTIWTYSRVSSAEAGALHQLVMSTLQREHIRSSVTLSGGSLANAAATRSSASSTSMSPSGVIRGNNSPPSAQRTKASVSARTARRLGSRICARASTNGSPPARSIRPLASASANAASGAMV